MSTEPGHGNLPPVLLEKDTEREVREAVIEDAANSEVDDRDLVHGEGGTLGLGKDENLSRDD